MKIVTIMALFLGLFLSAAFLPNKTYAQNSFIPTTSCGQHEGLTNKIVSCVEGIVSETVLRPAIRDLRQRTSQVVSACLILYIMFFGIRVVLGDVQQGTAGETMAVLLTVVGVIYFTQSTGLEDYIFLFKDVQKELVEITTSSIGNSTLCDYDNVWQQVDCTIGHIMGAHPISPVGDNSTFQVDPRSFADHSSEPFSLNQAIYFSPVIIMVGLLISPFGPFLLLLGLFIPILMIAAFGQAILVYITSLLVISFLGLIGPIIVPLFLFKRTFQIFSNWLQMLFAYTLQPAIILGYLTFMVHAMQFVIEGPGGLQEYYNNAVNQARLNQLQPEEVITAENATQIRNRNRVNKSTDRNRGSELQGWHLPNFEFFGDDEAAKAATAIYFRNLLVLAVLLAVTFAFMVNVMNFGAQLAGVGASSLGNIANIFNKTAGRITKTVSRK